MKPFRQLRSRFLLATLVAIHGAGWWSIFIASETRGFARQPDRHVRLWPGIAPGEDSESEGTVLPFRPEEDPPVTRVVDISAPSIDLYLPAGKPVAAVLVLPGGGYTKVVPDKEGAELADLYTPLGIACAVVRYRTIADGRSVDAWRRPVQDSQRGMRWLRAECDRWNVPDSRLGIVGFSAGGQVVAIHLSQAAATYAPIDQLDALSPQPAFAILVYPWRLVEDGKFALRDEVRVTPSFPPTWIVHAHDDPASSMSSVLLYAQLKRHEIPAELHIFASGGHGYGTRQVAGADVHTWPNLAARWLHRRGIIASPD